ncbi:unnamed protein product [Lathyrus oleraceus]
MWFELQLICVWRCVVVFIVILSKRLFWLDGYRISWLMCSLLLAYRFAQIPPAFCYCWTHVIVMVCTRSLHWLGVGIFGVRCGYEAWLGCFSFIVNFVIKIQVVLCMKCEIESVYNWNGIMYF